MLGSGEQGRGDERERAVDGHEVPVDGAGDAIEAVPAQPCAPMDVGLEEPAGDRGHERQHERQREHPSDAEPRRGAILEEGALAHRKRREPADDDRRGSGERERDHRDDRKRRAAGTVLEHAGGDPGRDRVRDAASRQHDQDGASGDGGESDAVPSHLTASVNGAVRTRPSTFDCRNSRHVPGTGRRTPTRSWPGRVVVPVTRAPPRMLVQPDMPGEHTCV